MQEEKTTAGSGFKSGFMGCFGVLAAVALVVFGLLVWNAKLGADLEAKSHNAAQADDYKGLCSTALVSAQQRASGLESFPADVETYVVQDPGPPPRIQCAFTGQGGHVVAVTFKAVCGSWMESRCVQVSSASLDGRLVLADAPTRAALKSSRGSRHHHHHPA